MAALQTGARSTFNDTVGLRQDISNDVPILVDPYDIPLYSRLMAKGPSVEAYKHEWLEDSLQPSTFTMTDTFDSVETVIDTTLSEETKVKTGDLLRIRSSGEVMRVTSTATNAINVNRGYAGTVAAVSTLNEVVDIIGQAVADGADPQAAATTNLTPKFNFQQTFQEAITVTDLDMWVKVFGISDKFSREVEKKLKVLAIRSEKAFIYGQRFEDATNSTRLMGGLKFFIVTNAKAEASAEIDEDLVRARLQLVYDKGGRTSLLVGGPTQKGKLSQLISVAQRRFQRPGGQENPETIGVVADEFQSDFGTQEILMDRNILADELYYLEWENIAKITGMPFTLENLAKTGTSRKAQIVGWFSLEVKAESHHAFSTGLKTT